MPIIVPPITSTPNPAAGGHPPFNPNGLTNVMRYVGEPNTPKSIRDLRANNLDTMRYVGSPVIVKHMFNDEDFQQGQAARSPNWSDTYGQPRHDDPISHGIGFTGTGFSTNEWISPSGALVVSNTSPGAGYVQAPRYRGFGPGYLIYMIVPDASEDVFKLSPTGALIRVQEATAMAPWYPEINDNDLITLVEIDDTERVIATYERYQAKMTSPVSVRGTDRRGRRERPADDYGNRNAVQQNFQMTLVPVHDELYNVELDR